MRSQDPDYPLLHELARHGIHVSETLEVALQTLTGMIQQHDDYMSKLSVQGICQPSHIHDRLLFQRGCLEAIFSRSKSINARIQNEITLVKSQFPPSNHANILKAFNIASQRDTKIQLQIGQEAGREAMAMKAIAVVTMTFLPATFVAVRTLF
jgi:hypothetical protein